MPRPPQLEMTMSVFEDPLTAAERALAILLAGIVVAVAFELLTRRVLLAMVRRTASCLMR